MANETVIQIPFLPRQPQREVLKGLWAHRFGVLVTHRRWGKTYLAANLLQQKALMCQKDRPRVAMVGPTYRQTKATMWDYAKLAARPIPGISINESELRVDYPNGGQVRLFGGDDPDALRGMYFDYVVFDEYGLHQGDIFTTVIRPELADRGGGALFLGTPNGKNQFYDLLRKAQSDPEYRDWFWAVYKVSETGIVPPEELKAARSVMSQDEYDQEFECSFEASVKGAIYSQELASCRADGRICKVPYDPVLPVTTAWDIGMSDATAIWFVQKTRSGEVRLIDYYENSGEGLPFYAKILKEKGYAYEQHIGPHDLRVREMTSGRSRVDVARSLGIRFYIAPNLPLEDGIHAARMLFPRCWFDEKKCDVGLEVLGSYRRDWNQRINEFKAVPVHDWSEHGSSAFRYLALALADVHVQKNRRPVRVSTEGSTGWMG